MKAKIFMNDNVHKRKNAYEGRIFNFVSIFVMFALWSLSVFTVQVSVRSAKIDFQISDLDT